MAETASALHTLGQAGDLMGVSRNLVSYLVSDRQIPVRIVGNATVLDPDGIARLRRAVDDFQSKRRHRLPRR